MTPDVIDYTETEKLTKPSIYLTELRDNMVLDGAVNAEDVPSRAAISKCTRLDLFMSYKKLSVTPLESTTANNVALTDAYLEEVSDLNPATLHFFDDSGVVKTTGNRKFGCSYIGEPGFEFQRSAYHIQRSANSVSLFKRLNWLAFHDEVKLNKCVLVYKRFHGNCPLYIKDMLTSNADIQTRSSGRYSQRNLVCPRYNRVMEGGKSFQVSTSKLWNSLPPHIKTSDKSVGNFKKELFNYFFNKYNDIDSFSIS